MRVAVIGAGPAGVYAVDALARDEVEVDVFDLLPTPYGLVRYGVAPDHVKMKSVIRTLKGVLETPGVRFIGNVAYGEDLTLADFRQHYDAVLFATGSPFDRRMDIPGEDLPGSFAAPDFVAWYSGHPSARQAFPLDATAVAVIGAGNVALDVARVLAKGADGLAHTDVPHDVLDALRYSAVRDVHIVARRGPAQAKFTQVELREMGALEGVDTIVDADDLELDAASEEAMAARRPTRTMVGFFQDWATRELTGQSKRVYFHFLRRPVAILGEERVEGLQVERCHLDGTGGVTGTGDTETLPVQMVIRSVGYRGAPLAEMPFDGRRATVPNDAGRVEPGVYVAGWIKRGPTGVIGTNKSDAHETADTLLADAPSLSPAPQRDPGDILKLLDSRAVSYVTWDGWQRIDAHEIALGEADGRERVKVADLDKMLKVTRERG